jgi:hypothetical protein
MLDLGRGASERQRDLGQCTVCALQLFQNREMVRAIDDNEFARRAGGRASPMEVSGIPRQRRQFGRTIGDGQMLLHDGQTQRRQLCDFFTGQLQRQIQRSIAYRRRVCVPKTSSELMP